MTRRLRVVGFDLSLTSTGASDGHIGQAFQTAPGELLEARLDRLVRQCVRFALKPAHDPSLGRADVVVIEGAAFGAKGNAVEQLAALRLMVRHRMWRLGIPFALVSPTSLKRYTAGRGNATKSEMIDAVSERHGVQLDHIKVKDGRSDIADAYALAAMGYAWYGQPLYSRYRVPVDSTIESVDWPQLGYGDRGLIPAQSS